MLEKLKNFAEGFKDIMLYILTPVAFVAGFIYYILSKNKELEDTIKAKDGEEKLNELQGKQQEIDSGADHASADYATLRAEYIRKFGVSPPDPSVRQSPGSKGPADKDQG